MVATNFPADRPRGPPRARGTSSASPAGPPGVIALAIALVELAIGVHAAAITLRLVGPWPPYQPPHLILQIGVTWSVAVDLLGLVMIPPGSRSCRSCLHRRLGRERDRGAYPALVLAPRPFVLTAAFDLAVFYCLRAMLIPL